MSSDCFDKFLVSFLTDIGVPTATTQCIQKQADAAITAYQSSLPKKGIVDIANDYYECSSKIVADATSSIVRLVMMTVVIICIITLLTAVLIILCVMTQDGYLRIVLVTVMVIFYVLIVALIGYSAYSKTKSIISSRSNSLNTCRDTAVAAVAAYENAQTEALDKAFCTFADTTC
jgi:uncharacterized membrane protein YqjE